MTTRGIHTTLLAVAFAGAVMASAVTHAAPVGSFVGERGDSARMVAEKPVNVPVWGHEHAEQYPGCAPTLPEGVIPATVVAVDLTGEVSRMAFDKAWTATHNDNAADNVWIVGMCA